jgi:hypothetical protein
MFVDLAGPDNPREAAMWWFALPPESRDYWLLAAKTDNPRQAWEHYRRVAKEHQRLTHVVRELDAAVRRG